MAGIERIDDYDGPIEISGYVDDAGEAEVRLDERLDWITKEDAVNIIEHLTKLFDLTDKRS